eukprot:g24549.t1
MYFSVCPNCLVAKCLCQEENEEKTRVAPGQSLKPATSDVFQRLHASHAARMEKLSAMKELAEREEAERLQELRRRTIRTCSSEDEAGQIYGRLYQEAELQRQRRELREQQEWGRGPAPAAGCFPEGGGCKGLRFPGLGDPPRWEQLYNSAPLKEKRLGEERQKAHEEEEKWLAQNCIHRSNRMEKLRAANAASQAQQLASGSVHASCQLSEAELMDRTRRLYEDGLQRLERLEAGYWDE